ncbi:MAG TPA: type IV secretion system protein [Rhodanobacteraceae bacterium]
MHLFHRGSTRIAGPLYGLALFGALLCAAPQLAVAQPAPPTSSAPSALRGDCPSRNVQEHGACVSPKSLLASLAKPKQASQSKIAADLKADTAAIAELPETINRDLFGNITPFFNVFVSAGQKLLALAFILSFVTLTWTWYIKGGISEYVFSLLRLLIVTSIPLAVLGTVHGAGFWPKAPEVLTHAITGGLATMIDHVNPDASFAGAGAAAAVHGAGTGRGQAVAVVQNLLGALSAHLNVPAVTATGADGIIRAIVQSVLAIVLFVPFVLFALALLFSLYGPLLMIDIGIVMGPLLIPWIVWDPLSNLTMTWLKYMLTMCMAFLVCILMADVVIAAVGAMLTEAFSAGTTVASLGDIALLFPAVIVLLFMGYMLFKGEAIAAALMGGPHIGSGGVLLAAGLGVSRMMTGGSKKPGKPGGAKTPGLPGAGASGAGAATGGGAGAGAGAAAGGGGGSGASSLSSQAGNASMAGGGSSGASSGGGQAGSGGDAAFGASIGGASQSSGDSAPGAGDAGAGAGTVTTAGVGGGAAAPDGGKAGGGRWSGVKGAAGAMHKGYLHGRDGTGRGQHGMHLIAKSTAIGAAAVLGGPVAGGAVAAYVLSRHARGAVHSVADPLGKGAAKVGKRFVGGNKSKAPDGNGPKG